DALGHEVAYQNKFLNKKDRIKSHLKKCENFKAIVGEQNINQILEEILKKEHVQLNQKPFSVDAPVFYDSFIDSVKCHATVNIEGYNYFIFPRITSALIIAPSSDTSDSVTEFIIHSDLGQGYEIEPEEETKNLEARETLQHEKLIKSGYLAKKKQERRKSGEKIGKRWFVLRSTKLAYYKSEKVTPKRTYYVQAESKKMLEAINKVKKEVQEEELSDKGSHADITSEEENDMMDATNDENDEINEGEESRIIHQGYVYKLDRYKYKSEIEPISKPKLHCFKVITPGRTYICCAPNDETQVARLAAIQVALSKIKEKNKDTTTGQNTIKKKFH
ncbi:13986_t:CDS:2, partial [Entrophospora sp. SA101]